MAHQGEQQQIEQIETMQLKSESIATDIVIIDDSLMHLRMTKDMLDELKLTNYQAFDRLIDEKSFNRYLNTKTPFVCIINSHALINNKELFSQLSIMQKHQAKIRLVLTANDIARFKLPDLPVKPVFILDDPLLPSDLVKAINVAVSNNPNTVISLEKNNNDKLKHTDFNQSKLLLVEDNKVNQMVAKALLKRLKLDVTIANNGKEAIELFEQQNEEPGFQLILMDIQMPVMDGLKATEIIRNLKEFNGKYIPIIALTAHALAEEKQRCEQAGMNDHISKPIDPENLIRVLTKWLL